VGEHRLTTRWIHLSVSNDPKSQTAQSCPWGLNRDSSPTDLWQDDYGAGTMKYQLILQFEAGSMVEFDRLVALEDELIEKLGDLAMVDGHDFGSGQFNIFVLTDAPAASFRKAHEIVATQGTPNVMRSAYRELDGEDYVILWPSSLTDFSVL
jgi:hypothetical protein